MCAVILSGVPKAAATDLCTVDPEWGGTGATGVSWMSVAVTGILVLLFFLAFVYMAGVLLSRIEWIVWVKDEFYQALISIFFLFLSVGIATTACEASFSLAGGNPFAVADIYLNDLIWEKTLRVSTGVFLTGIYASLTGAFFVPIGQAPSGFRPLAGLDSVTTLMNFLFLVTSTMFSSLMIQSMGLKLAQGLAFKVILPFGILFRVFPFLRKAGAAFIAIGLGLYIVWPMMYVLDKAVMDSIEVPRIIYEDNPDLGAQIYTGAFTSLYSYDAAIRIVMPMTHVQDVANLVPQAVFLPALNLLVVYAFMKAMTRVFSQNFPSPFS